MDSLLIFIHVYINFLNEIEIALGIDAITETMEAHCLFCIGIMDWVMDFKFVGQIFISFPCFPPPPEILPVEMK